MQTYQCILILEDQTKYYGWSFNQSFTAIGEIVFNTGMTGYQEIMTDPSYSGQIVNFTYPELGNTGINNEDNESKAPYLAGIIAKNLCVNISNWRSNKSLANYLIEQDIPHIYGIDTRSLTKHLRKAGTMNGCISSNTLDINNLLKLLNSYPSIQERDLISHVSTKTSYNIIDDRLSNYIPIYNKYSKYENKPKEKLTIVVLDFGTKNNILRNLISYIKTVIILPANSDINDILQYKPDGILLSNGPGDPKAAHEGINTVKQLLSLRIPLFGICMGHQVLSLALGLDTFKLKFGHRGLNHPIGNNKNIEISSQNHGFAIYNDTNKLSEVIINQLNYNDKTIAAITHRKYPYFSVQYHPEASPGPHDSENLFLHFVRIIKVVNKYPDLINLTI